MYAKSKSSRGYHQRFERSDSRSYDWWGFFRLPNDFSDSSRDFAPMVDRQKVWLGSGMMVGQFLVATQHCCGSAGSRRPLILELCWQPPAPHIHELNYTTPNKSLPCLRETTGQLVWGSYAHLVCWGMNTTILSTCDQDRLRARPNMISGLGSV